MMGRVCVGRSWMQLNKVRTGHVHFLGNIHAANGILRILLYCTQLSVKYLAFLIDILNLQVVKVCCTN